MALRIFLRSKIHRALVTRADVDYIGSIAIDEDLMDAAGLTEFEQVHVAGLNHGERVVTYAIKAPRGSKQVEMNGAAALKIHAGERIIVFAYAAIDEAEIAAHLPAIVLIKGDNQIDRVVRGRAQ